MKKTLRFMMVALIAISVTFTSCKKADKDKDNAELTTHTDDAARFDSESDAIDNDVNASVESFAAFEGKPTNVLTLPCNADVTLDSTATHRRITITYHGLNCIGTRLRNGVVVLTMPLGQRWRDVGAVLTINITHLVITRVSDSRSITIDGIHTITNVTGGRLSGLGMPGAPPIIHDISSPGMTVTFEDGTNRSWQVAKRRVFSYSNGIVITTNGTHSDGGIDHIAVWGTNRFGNPFVTSITAPMVIRQDCGFRLVSGQVTHQRMLATAVVTFGLDSGGLPTTCPAGVFYYKLVWTGANGVVITYILPY